MHTVGATICSNINICIGQEIWMNAAIKTTLTFSLHCLCKIPKIESRDEGLIATPVKLGSRFQNLAAKGQRKTNAP